VTPFEKQANHAIEHGAPRIAAVTAVLGAPPAILLIPGVGSAYLGLCVLAGLLIAIQQRRALAEVWQQDRAVRWFGILLLVYLLVSLANYALVDSSSFAYSRLTRQVILLAIPILFILLWWARPTIRMICTGLALNAMGFGFYAIGFHLLMGKRVDALTHAIHFGNAGLLLGFSALGLLALRIPWPWRVLGLMGLGLGITASFLSESRGGWLAIPLLLVISLITMYKADRPSKRLWLAISVAIILALGLAAGTDRVQQRVADGQRDIERMSNNDHLTSIGYRVLMWRIALEAGLDAPWFGHGFSGYARHVDTLIEKGEIPSRLARFRTEPHSDYLYLFATRGLSGLIAYAALLLIPTVYLLATLRRGDPRQKASAQVGLSLIIVLAIGGLTITMVDQRAMIRFLSVMASLALYLAWNSRASLASDKDHS